VKSPDIDESVSTYLQMLQACWLHYVRKQPESARGNAARDANVMMLGMAMRNLAAVGFTQQQVEHAWQQIITEPGTIEFIERVRSQRGGGG
jgi:hypothetical protein